MAQEEEERRNIFTVLQRTMKLPTSLTTAALCAGSILLLQQMESANAFQTPNTASFVRHSASPCTTSHHGTRRTLNHEKHRPVLFHHLSKPIDVSFSTRLYQQGNNNNFPPQSQSSSSTASSPSPLLQDLSRLLQRTSWFSWWTQTILTVISCTILLFAGNATKGKAAVARATPSFFLSGLGLTVSFLSILWTWGNGTRLSRRLLRNKSSTQQPSSSSPAPSKNPLAFRPAPPHALLRRAIRVQVGLNLVGLFLTLLAAEEIVGSLALKVLTAGNGLLYGGSGVGAEGFVQPLDILIVQANTNTLLSHFASLSTALYLADRVRLLQDARRGGGGDEQ